MVLNSVYGGRSSKLLTVCYFESLEKIIKKKNMIRRPLEAVGRQYTKNPIAVGDCVNKLLGLQQ